MNDGPVQRAVDRVVGRAIAARVPLLVLIVALVAASLASASRVKVDGSIEAWFLEDDAALARYDAFRERFGTDEFVLVVFFGDAVLTPGGLTCVEAVREGADALPESSRTRWLTTVTTARAVGDDEIVVGPLCKAIPGTEAGVRALWDEALASSVARGLVSRDRRPSGEAAGSSPAGGERAVPRSGTLDPPATAVLVELTRDAQTVEGKLALIDGLRRVLAREDPARAGLEVVVSGPPAFDEAFVRHTERDLGRLGPIGLLGLFLVIAVSMRRVSLALVPVAIVTTAVLVTLGAMGVLGLRLNLVSTNLVCVMLAIGVAESIHLVSEHRAQAATGLAPRDAARRAAALVFGPCVFTTLTTVLGMLSLVWSSVRPIREFGALAAGGVALSFAATFAVGPLLLSFVTPGPAPPPAARRSAAFARMGPTTRRLILAGTALAVLLSWFGVRRLEVGVNPVEYFRKDDPLRAGTERVDAALGGTASIELQVDAPGGGLEEPAVLARMADLRARVERERGVSYTQSVLDPLEDMHRVWTAPSTPGDEPRSRATSVGRPGDADAVSSDRTPMRLVAPVTTQALPGTRALTAQYLLWLEAEEDLGRVLLREHSTGRLSLRTQMSMTDKPTEVIDRIAAHARAVQVPGEPPAIEVTGFVHLMATMYAYLLDSQIQSALIAVPTVLLAMLLLLRRLSLGVLALIPNVLPLLFSLALMGALGIRLDVGTVMVGSITLGIVVDDTVHLLVRLREELARATSEAEVPAALERTLAEVGGSMLTISLAFIAGFGALAFGGFLVNVYFGALSTLVVLLALACDLVITPALVLSVPGWFLPAQAAKA